MTVLEVNGRRSLSEANRSGQVSFTARGPKLSPAKRPPRSFLSLRQISRVLTQMAARRAPPYRLTRRWPERCSGRRRQRAGHDHAAFGVVADIEGRANGFGPVTHDSLSHALRLVEILPQPSAVVFDRQDDLAVCVRQTNYDLFGLRVFGGVVNGFLRDAIQLNGDLQ